MILRGWSLSTYTLPSLSSAIASAACSIPFMIVEYLCCRHTSDRHGSRGLPAVILTVVKDAVGSPTFSGASEGSGGGELVAPA